MPGTALVVDGFICLPLSPFICLPLSPSLDTWHSSLGEQIHSSPIVSQPGCLARLSGWTDSFVSLCLPSFVLCSSVVSHSGTALRADGFICPPLSPFTCLLLFPSPAPPFVSICLPLSPTLGQPGCLARLSGCGWTVSFVSHCLPSFVSHCLPAWMWHASPLICLPLSPSRCLSAWMPALCPRLSPCLDAWHAPLGGRIHLR